MRRSGLLTGRAAGAATVAYLAVGGLSLKSNTARPAEALLLERGGVVAPRRIVPIYWDSLAGPLTASVAPNDDGKAGIAFIEERANTAGIGFQLPTIGSKVDPFAGL